MGVWQGVAMDSLKLHPGPPCPTLLRPAASQPRNSLSAISGVTRPQGGQPVVVFYPVGHPTPYAYGPKAPQGHLDRSRIYVAAFFSPFDVDVILAIFWLALHLLVSVDATIVTRRQSFSSTNI
jgi:hypothetical protein